MDEISYPSLRSHFSLHPEELHSNQAQLNHVASAVSSGFSHFTPQVANPLDTNTIDGAFLTPATYQISSGTADKETHFAQPFEPDTLQYTRKRHAEQTMNARALKVPAKRSQKLSDRITSLQRVVSPYGKTDTASVLQETCMFIRIAHQEIRRLTVSYFSARPLQPQCMNGITQKSDLRSRGLCLFPLSMTIQISDENVAESSSSPSGVTTIMSPWGF